MLRTIRQVPDEADRKYLRDWARDEFKRNKNATDQVETGSDCVPINALTCWGWHMILIFTGCHPYDGHTSQQPPGGAAEVSGSGQKLVRPSIWGSLMWTRSQWRPSCGFSIWEETLKRWWRHGNLITVHSSLTACQRWMELTWRHRPPVVTTVYMCIKQEL